MSARFPGAVRVLASLLAVSLLFACSEPGGSLAPGSESEALIGGEPDTLRKGVVGMVISQSSGCTGTLIAPNLVLTARHCVASLSSGTGAVQCGTTEFGAEFAPSDFIVTWDANLQDGVSAGTNVSVSDVRTPTLTDVCGTDIALLILGRNVLSSSAEPIAPRVDSAPQTNEVFDAVGYGITSPNDNSGETFGRRLHVDDLRVGCVGAPCGSMGGTATEWGATTPVCQGDSGGPALDGSGRVIGVASRGNQNCTGALYGSVYSWRNLITDTARDAATIGGYPVPPWAGGADAGSPMDAGTNDAGTPPNDAGTSYDAGGSPVDAGAPADAGASDAGGVDSGMGDPDAGTATSDAGGDPPDAGGGGFGDDDGGCGCRVARPSSSFGAFPLAALALVSLARRRRAVRRA